MNEPLWNGRTGTAGGETFGASLRSLAAEREVPLERLADAVGLPPARFEALLAGNDRLGVAALAALANALRCRPMEFLQRTGILGLDSYAFGLDPLYFLPEGPIRYDARIYMREINPRHAVPEADMTKRNAALKAIADDEILDALGKMELELTYLLRAAVQITGGTLG